MMATTKPKKKDNESSIQVISVTDVSPHSKALYEAGKSLLIDSVTTAREFCKSMITISTGAIPIYLGMLSYLLPKDYKLGANAGITIAVPAIGFLIAALIFVGGYLPITSKFSLDIIEEIEHERDKVINHRRKFVWSGVIVFILSALAAISAIVINIGAR
jgi:hypothetical protein